MYCKNCGNLVDVGCNYCKYCGQPMTEVKSKPSDAPTPPKPVNYGLIGLLVSLAGLVFVVVFYFATVGGESYRAGYRGWGVASYGHRMSIESIAIGMILTSVFSITAVVLSAFGKTRVIPPQRSYFGITLFLSISIIILAIILFVVCRPAEIPPM